MPSFPLWNFGIRIQAARRILWALPLAVWEVAMIDESYGHSAEQTAADLRWPLTRAEPVLAHARTYQQEIAAAPQENRTVFSRF